MKTKSSDTFLTDTWSVCDKKWTIWVMWQVSYKRQELLTLREHLGSTCICNNLWILYLLQNYCLIFTRFKYLQIIRNYTWYSLSFPLLLHGLGTIVPSIREITVKIFRNKSGMWKWSIGFQFLQRIDV